MTPAGGRRGRRDNGLTANEYAPVGDVDPRIGEHLLEILAVAGIAAYLQPSADQHPVTRTTTLPSRPTDRLYVDRAHRAEAREHLNQLTSEDPDSRPGPGDAAGTGLATATGSSTATDEQLGRRAGPPTDMDVQWQRIVDQFDTPAAEADPPWPAAEDIDDDSDGDRPAGDRDEASDTPARTDRSTRWWSPQERGDDVAREEPTLLDALDADLGPEDENDDEGYTPPPPPPLPRISRHAVLSLLAIAGGLALFLWPQLLPMVSPDLVQILGVGAVLAGTVGLVWRLRAEPADDADPDDGAVV